MKIDFYNESPYRLPNKRVLRGVLEQIFTSEGKALNSLAIILCSDEFLLNLNKEHLDHDYYTDILTFDISEGKDIDGEIYISIDRVKDNAVKFNSMVINELHRIMIHGILHLCGYEDNTKLKKEKMTGKEDFYLQVFSNVSRETSPKK